MDLKEILTRKSPSFYTVEEACFVVEQYIYQVTNKKVKINIYKGTERLSPTHQMYTVLISNQLRLLNDAFIKSTERIKI